MRYIGSKTATLPWLGELVSQRAPDSRSLLDPFAGTCTVARHFKRRGFRVVTGDVLHLSHILQIATVRLDEPPKFSDLRAALKLRRGETSEAEDILTYLNGVPGYHGYIAENFSSEGVGQRMFFSSANASKIDAVRQAIRDWRRDGYLTGDEHAYLLASLINAVDRVANTAGTYYAHLKILTRKAQMSLELRLLDLSPGQPATCQRADAREVVRENTTDVLYLDPPYNERNYERYYHLPETLAREVEPTASGRSGVPVEVPVRSDFCNPARARFALAALCEQARAKHIIFHYATDGLVAHDEIVAILAQRGDVRVDEIDVRGYAASRATTKKARHRVYWCDVRQRT